MPMHFWTAYAFLLLNISDALAATGGGHGSLKDLIAPTVNVAILLGLLAWKLKGPIGSYFVSRSEDVANTLERANLKSKEAQLMLDGESRKVINLQNEIKTIHQQSENDVKSFEKKLSQETEEKTHKLKIDANSKIQADKKEVLDGLNTELLNQVIAITKTTIKKNKDYQDKVSAKLLKGL
jgi:F0F1-type ATP synthase membrane subunit b/b'